MTYSEKVGRMRAAKRVWDAATTPEEQAAAAPEFRAAVLAVKNHDFAPSRDELMNHITGVLADNPTDEQAAMCAHLLDIILEGKPTEDQAHRAAALLGSIKSQKKAASSRENGKRGGRPRTKYPPGMNYQFNDARVSQPQPVLIPLNRKPTPAPSPAPGLDEFTQETGSEVE